MLSPASIKAMYQDTVSLETNPTMAKAYPNHDYGYGWMSSKVEGQRLIWHNGGFSSQLSYAFFLPDQKIGGVILMNKLDRFATQNLWYQNMLSVASYLAGGELKPLPSGTYWTTHLIVGAVCLLFLAIPLASLLRLKRFKDQLVTGRRKKRRVIVFLLLHLLLPISLLSLPSSLTGLSLGYLGLLYSDIYLVLLAFVSLCILAGLVKLYLWLEHRRAVRH